MRAILLVLVLLVVVAACGKEKGRETAADGAAPVVTTASGKPKPPWPADAPDRNAACTKHEECAVSMHDAILPPDPCCTQRVGFLPVTRAYAEWTSTYRTEHCTGVVCPTSPLPGAEPVCCASIGRCVNKKCVGGCEDPTLVAPKVVWHDPGCQLAPR